MQSAAGAAQLPGVLHDWTGRRGAAKSSVNGNLLASNASGPPAFRWHDLSEYHGMIPLLLAFFAIGALMCVLIGLDRPMADVVETMPHDDPLKFSSHRSPREVELLPGLEVESGHTAAGFPRGK